MKGQIVKILSNLYFVNCDGTIYECHSRGVFRNKNITPVVGDYCIIDSDTNYILEILPRKNFLIRPLVANIDQGLIVTSLKTPDFSTNLLDKLILVMELNSIKPIICITKEDIVDDSLKTEVKGILDYYKKIGYTVFYNYELDEIKKIFKDKTTVFTGQTGAGKSSLFNKLDPSLNLSFLIYTKNTSSLSSDSLLVKISATKLINELLIPFIKGKNVSKYFNIWSDIIGI